MNPESTKNRLTPTKPSRTGSGNHAACGRNSAAVWWKTTIMAAMKRRPVSGAMGWGWGTYLERDRTRSHERTTPTAARGAAPGPLAPSRGRTTLRVHDHPRHRRHVDLQTPWEASRRRAEGCAPAALAAGGDA